MAYIIKCPKCGQNAPPPFFMIEGYDRQCCMDCSGVLWSDYELAGDIVFGLDKGKNRFNTTDVDDVALKIAKYRKLTDAK